MSTGYTAAQLDELWQVMLRQAPTLPSAAVLKSAPQIKRVATAGTEVGMLLRLSLKDRAKPVTFFLNCAVALELMFGINRAALEAKWWDQPETSNAKPLPDLQREDLDSSRAVVSLMTASEPNGLFVIFSDRTTPFTFYIPRRFAAELLSLINGVGEKAQWWDKNFQLLPTPN